MGLIKETQYKETHVITGFTCNRCNQNFTDILDVQEMFHYSFTGGFGSVFGDMSTFEVTLCQNCLKDTLGGYIEVKQNDTEL